MQTPDIPRDTAQEVLVPVEPLRDLVRQVLVKQRMFAAEAQIAADRLVEADLRGIHSHGTRALPRYLQAMEMGDIDPRAESVTVCETPAMAVIDAGKGMGHVAATRGMQAAIRKAAEVGTGTVVIKRGQHYGACGLYTLMAAEAGMIGYTTTSTGRASITAYGSRSGGEANHGLSWGAPVQDGAPLVLDMAVAASSWGKIESLGLYGLPVPEGWGLDAEGNPTTVAGAIKTLLPAAGARGFGQALFCSLLTGGLAGGRFPIEKNRPPEVEGSEHFFYAIDISKFLPLETYYERIAEMCRQIRELPPTEGFDKVRLPGELEWERTQEWRASGVPLHREHVAELEGLARAHKVEVPW